MYVQQRRGIFSSDWIRSRRRVSFFSLLRVGVVLALERERGATTNRVDDWGAGGVGVGVGGATEVPKDSF